MKRQQDHYTRKAQSMGYPARSVFKLEEIDRKFSVLAKGPVLDLGAAPGSWSLYCLKHAKGPVYGVDLQEVSITAPGYTFIQGDIFDPGLQERLTSAAPYTTILSDAAPSTTGNRTVDTARSYQLVESIIHFSFPLLSRGGNLVLKVFQGGDERDLFDLLVRRFDKAKIFKPQASRDESFEVFFVAKGYTG
ncbi:MAG: RlmE family RNA methyltransferase [Spirochaetales bacterium]|nr:RlmE family RNA methyltransferase [Spirochaetales bacterium]